MVQGKSVCEYLGIPYASSPKGRLRFAKPVPRSAWKKTLNATSFSSSCPQRFPDWARWMMRPNVRRYSEDCLHLNIWSTSGSASGPGCNNKPVLFWIHGGGFQFGAGSLIESNGSVLAALHDVIVVTINYRLNAFGFLSLENDQVPGNMGLYDQAMALQWVKENAAVFGGDANSITIWGQGMGSISVSAHLVSPVSKDLFKRAIMQTGSIFTSPEMYSRSREVAEQFVAASGCRQMTSNEKDEDDESGDEDDYEDGFSEEVINCLRKAPLEHLMQAVDQVNSKNPVAFLFTPFEDFFNHSTPVAIRNDLKNFFSSNIKDLLLGFNSDEGSLLLNSLSPETFPESGDPLVQGVEEAQNFLINLFTTRFGIPKSIIMTGVISEFSANISTSKEEIRKLMIDFVGNNIFICPTIIFGEEVALMQRGASVHLFTVTSRSGYNHLPDWFGTIHNEEVPIMFGLPIASPNEFSVKDIEFSRKFMQTITSFARSG